MKNNKLKKILVGAMACACVFTTTVPVQAASTVTATVDKATVTGKVSKGGSYATATTTWAHTGGTRTTKITYYYKFGAGKYYSVASARDTQNTAGTTVSSKRAGSVSYGAKGEHSVKTTNSSSSWSGKTTIGTVPSSNSGWVLL